MKPKMIVMGTDVYRLVQTDIETSYVFVRVAHPTKDANLPRLYINPIAEPVVSISDEGVVKTTFLVPPV